MKYTEKQTVRRKEIVQQVLQKQKTSELEQLSVRRICEVVQISTGSFYHYFENQSDFFNEALEGIEAYLTKNVEPLIDEEKSEKDNLVIFSRGYAGHVKEVGNAGIKSIRDFSYPLASTREELEKEKEALIYKIPCGILKRGQEKGQFRSDIEVSRMTIFLQNIYRGLAIDWMRRNCFFDIERRYLEETFIYLKMIELSGSN